MQEKSDDTNKLAADQLASSLLERRPTDDYLQEWTRTIMSPPAIEKKGNMVSVVIFRLGKEWLAMRTIFFKEVMHHRPVHKVPHRTNKFLLGLINLDGELQLCVALSELLEIETSMTRRTLSTKFNRMIAVSHEKKLWVFPVDEVEGIHLWNLSLLENVPVNVTKSAANYLKGMMFVKQKNIGLLDEELVFYSLTRGVQ